MSRVQAPSLTPFVVLTRKYCMPSQLAFASDDSIELFY